MKGLFGNMFDLNRDGTLNTFERAMDLMAFEELETEGEDTTDYDDDDTELMEAGIDPEELEYMDAAERREVLEEAGLDPDDYDF